MLSVAAGMALALLQGSLTYDCRAVVDTVAGWKASAPRIAVTDATLRLVDSVLAQQATVLRASGVRGRIVSAPLSDNRWLQPIRDRTQADPRSRSVVEWALASAMRGEWLGYSWDQAWLAVVVYEDMQGSTLPAGSVLGDPFAEPTSRLIAVTAINALAGDEVRTALVAGMCILAAELDAFARYQARPEMGRIPLGEFNGDVLSRILSTNGRRREAGLSFVRWGGYLSETSLLGAHVRRFFASEW